MQDKQVCWHIAYVFYHAVYLTALTVASTSGKKSITIKKLDIPELQVMNIDSWLFSISVYISGFRNDPYTAPIIIL